MAVVWSFRRTARRGPHMPPADPPPDDLLARLKAGDRDAQNEWWAEHLPGLTRLTDRGYGVPAGRGGGASDVVQNVAAEVLRGIPAHIGSPAALDRWVRVQLRHRAIDLARKRVHIGFVDDADGATAGPAAGQSSPSVQFFRREREAAIRAAVEAAAGDPDGADEVDGLAVVLLRQVDEVPLKVIARGLGVGCVAVGRAYLAAVAPLRPVLDRLSVGDWPPDQDTDRERLLRAVVRLTADQRPVVELCHLEPDAYPVADPETGKVAAVNCQYTLAEAGGVLGIEPGAVGGRAYRAMRALEGLLAGDR